MSKNLSSSTALHETAEQFHILVDSVEEYAIYLLDPNGNVITLEHRRGENQRLLHGRNHRKKLRLLLHSRRRCRRQTATQSARSEPSRIHS